MEIVDGKNKNKFSAVAHNLQNQLIYQNKNREPRAKLNWFQLKYSHTDTYFIIFINVYFLIFRVENQKKKSKVSGNRLLAPLAQVLNKTKYQCKHSILRNHQSDFKSSKARIPNRISKQEVTRERRARAHQNNDCLFFYAD